MKCRYHAAAVIVLLTFSILNFVVYDVSGADSSPGNLYALSAVLMDGDSGRVLYEKEGETPRPNASTTKVLTCILALENCKLNEKVTFSPYAAFIEPSKLYANAGEVFYLKDLL